MVKTNYIMKWLILYVPVGQSSRWQAW